MSDILFHANEEGAYHEQLNPNSLVTKMDALIQKDKNILIISNSKELDILFLIIIHKMKKEDMYLTLLLILKMEKSLND